MVRRVPGKVGSIEEDGNEEAASGGDIGRTLAIQWPGRKAALLMRSRAQGGCTAVPIRRPGIPQRLTSSDVLVPTPASAWQPAMPAKRPKVATISRIRFMAILLAKRLSPESATTV